MGTNQTTVKSWSATTNFKRYTQERRAFWDAASYKIGRSPNWSSSYHKRLIHVFRYLVTPGQRVIEFGCGHGDLLAALNPELGVGIDFSINMVEQARRRHHDLRFIVADVHNIPIDEKFDVIILSDLLNDVWDVQRVLEQAERLCLPETRIIINSYSRLWEIPLFVVQRLGLALPVLQRNWLTVEDIDNLANLADLEMLRHWHEILLPLPIPILSGLLNRIFLRFWPFKHFALTNFIMARPQPKAAMQQVEPSVSIIIPARNEEANIPEIFHRTPQIGPRTELIFVEGHSLDRTYATIESWIANSPNRTCKLFQQDGVGKGDAVRMGFANASGDILMILDADLTVPPEDLPRFYTSLVSRKGDFINGVRLVYPMEKQAMRFLNFLGNKFFSQAFSWLLSQSIKDTLCGTKVMWRTDYEKIAANRAYFGDFDPFGDFDLIFGAVKQNLKITDLPVRYHERKYGTTNIQRWKHGWLLAKMLIFAAGKIKFV